MKRGYTKSLITTASSKTNYLQRSVNSKIKVTCIYSNMNKSNYYCLNCIRNICLFINICFISYNYFSINF